MLSRRLTFVELNLIVSVLRLLTESVKQNVRLAVLTNTLDTQHRTQCRLPSHEYSQLVCQIHVTLMLHLLAAAAPGGGTCSLSQSQQPFLANWLCGQSVIHVALAACFFSGSHSTALIMVALCNRADHYIFALWFLSSSIFYFFYSSPNLSGCRLDVYHTSTHGMALVRI